MTTEHQPDYGHWADDQIRGQNIHQITNETEAYQRIHWWEQGMPEFERATLDEHRAARIVAGSIDETLLRIADSLERIAACDCDMADLFEEKIAPVMKEISEGVWE